jgi:hypothetical protein
MESVPEDDERLLAPGRSIFPRQETPEKPSRNVRSGPRSGESEASIPQVSDEPFAKSLEKKRGGFSGVPEIHLSEAEIKTSFCPWEKFSA